MFVFDAHVSVTYQTHNSKLLKQLKLWLNFWPPRKWSIATTFINLHVTKIPELWSEARKMLSHHNGNKWLLSGECVSSIFDLFANPEIMEKKAGVGFFLISRKIWG